jgi:type I restriction enzyme M protein
MTPSQLLDTQVPVDMVRSEIEDFLEVVQEGRRKMKATAASTLPNVFGGPQTDVQRLRDEIRSAAHEARLIADLMRPVEDPVGRAEWSYPYHIASLARRYRIGTHPAEQKDGLLKLGEGIARVLGILALSEIAARGGFDATLRRSFQSGATFGTWTTVIRKFVESVGEPSLPDLARLADPDGVSTLLDTLRELRNGTHHSHGVRAGFEIERDVRALDPHVVTAITAVNWLAGNPWDWVERCEYLDESSYRIVGLTLRGSHPGWEPFDRPSTHPLKPQRVYVNGSGGTPITLWPFAEVRVCATCQTRELFLLNKWLDDTLILRSLEEHEITITYPRPG